MTSQPRPSDEVLMEAVASGDRAALTTLYDRHAGSVFTFLVRWTGDHASAEDLMHDTFLRLLRPGVSPPAGAPFRPWLLRIARNLATDRHRRLRERSAEGVDRLPAGGDDPLTDLTDREDRSRLEAALDTLTPSAREVLLLRAREGLSHRDIGTHLGCSEGAARVRLHRALGALRSAWHALEVAR